MDIRAAEISAILKNQIKNFGNEAEVSEVGTVLSVGDGGFRMKSEKKMKEIIGSGIATILVSHSPDQVRRMATKVLWLHKGKQIMLGSTDEVCDRYDEFLITKKLPVIK